MLPPAVVEQQAKLGVSAEESKALRLQRQQARFRDRGGAFVPSKANPLLDILLARTVSGESPSKAQRVSPSKAKSKADAARQSSPRRKSKVGAKVTHDVTAEGEESNAIARSSKAVVQVAKSRTTTSNKRKSKAAETEPDGTAKPAPKRRGRPPKSRETAPEPESKIERPPPTNANSKSTSNDKGKRTGKAKPKSKQKLPEKIVEVLVSDDDRTLVEAPHKPTSSSKPSVKRKAGKTDEEEVDERNEDAPIAKRAKPSLKPAVAKGSSAKGPGSKIRRAEGEDESDEDVPVVKRAKIEPTAAGTNGSKAEKPRSAGKKKRSEDAEEEEDQIERPVPVPAPRTTESGKGKARADVVEDVEEEGSRAKKPTKANGKKRRALNEDGDEVDTIAVHPVKRSKTSSTAAPPRDIDAEREPVPVPRTTETGKGKGKARADVIEDVEEERLRAEKSMKSSGKRQPPVVEDVEQDGRERPLASKTKKRKKGDDNNDDRPRKAVKVADAGLQYPSSAKLKENDPTRIPASKQRRDQPEAPRSKQNQSEELPSRTKAVKGPPRDVLERIKASAARYHRLADSEPDELDCLS